MSVDQLLARLLSGGETARVGETSWRLMETLRNTSLPSSRTTLRKPRTSHQAKQSNWRSGILLGRKNTIDCGRFRIPRLTCSSSVSPLIARIRWKT
jgi:hypothetical protein